MGDREVLDEPSSKDFFCWGRRFLKDRDEWEPWNDPFSPASSSPDEDESSK